MRDGRDGTRFAKSKLSQVFLNTTFLTCDHLPWPCLCVTIQ